MDFDTWIHLVELFVVSGIAFSIWFVRKKHGK